MKSAYWIGIVIVAFIVGWGAGYFVWGGQGAEVTRLTEQVTALAQEKAALQGQVTALTQEKEALQGQVAQLTKDKERLEAENRDLQAKLTAVPERPAAIKQTPPSPE